ncbi:phage major tail tube protein [Massilia sp. YIM B02763]|uniref:phage major tail tube protein n=1 Tax=Massilia sp. YIM B02763 TaxID=3050130 RepID=UPI0025B69CBA|nr:phage major tail tube protein [Massilia sp. YIM B02763]MDN4056348.1 phage major tail tube protein [Massilia sp. YIM B02763]
MGMPRQLKTFATFIDGVGYAAECNEVTLPKLTRKMEEYRGGGMNRPMMTDNGGEKLQLEHSYGGLMRDILKQYGVTTHDGVQIRFVGSYRAADQADPMAVEITARGRHSEIDMGTAKPGDETTFKVTTELSYYKLTIDNEDVIEIDILNGIEKVNGVDLTQKDRKAIGLA